MKIVLDTKSLLIGLSVATLAFFTISGKSQSEPDNGKFRTEVFNDTVVILNTQNGDYIIAPGIRDVGKTQWIKGEFYSTFKTAKDNKRE